MKTSLPLSLALAAALLLPFAGGSALEAQTPGGHQQVISANPFGLLLEFFNAEFEKVVSASSTAGLGGSFIDLEEENYLNLDAFWRFYPQGTPLDGWSFGAKVGMTRVDDGTYTGFGFDVNRSWLLGANENFYVGLGFGLKRLLGTGDNPGFDARFIPTIRIVNVGIAF